MQNRILTISNALSFSRVVLAVPIAILLLSDRPGDRAWACGIVLVAILTDFLDGYFARRLHEVSEFGKVIDPIADKIGVGTVVVVLVLTKEVPLWYGVVVLLRDLLILAGGIAIRSSKGIIPQSNWPGKWAVGFVAAYLVLCMARIAWGQTLLLWVSIAFMALSFALYTQRLFIGRHVTA